MKNRPRLSSMPHAPSRCHGGITVGQMLEVIKLGEELGFFDPSKLREITGLELNAERLFSYTSQSAYGLIRTLRAKAETL
jgi:hypothetical protein